MIIQQQTMIQQTINNDTCNLKGGEVVFLFQTINDNTCNLKGGKVVFLFQTMNNNTFKRWRSRIGVWTSQSADTRGLSR